MVTLKALSQGVTFSADGNTIVAGNMVEKDLWIFEWNGSTLRDTGQLIKLNGGSAALRTAEKSRQRGRGTAGVRLAR